MAENPANLKIGYIVKMYPRLSETFILNEILELERRGAEIVIFSIKKPNEGQFHPQLSKVKAKVLYLEGLDIKRWTSWLGDLWPFLSPHRQRFWPLIEKTQVKKDNNQMELVLLSAWVAAKAGEFGLSYLHAHFASLPSTVAYFAHRITQIPFSFTAHAKDIYVYDMEEHFLREKLFAAQFTVTVTDYNRRYLVENAPGLDPDSIRVIYNGVDVERLKPDRHQDREPDLILAVGRLVPKKGFGNLLDACKLLKDRGISFRCLIAGDGQEAEQLRRKQQGLDLINEVEFLGPKRQDVIVELMKKSTILCLPCTIDGDGNRDALPTVILEAMACGLPVVSTNLSGIPEMIDPGIDGLLVEPDDPVSLSEQLTRLLSSEKLRRKLADGALKKVASKFNLKTNVGSLHSLFLEKKDRESVSKSTVRPKTG